LREMSVIKFEEAQGEGETVTSQASPLYTLHRRDIAHALLQHNTRDSIKRNAIIQVLGVSAGRGGEVATFSPDVLTWDPLYHCVVAEWAQIKTFKFKKVVLVAGADHLICPINAFALVFASGGFNHLVYEASDLNLFFPELAENSQPTTVVTNYLKALSRESKNKEYAANVVASLPPSPTAAGFRVGATNEMACNGISAELTMSVSGHDGEKLSCLFHYLNADLPCIIPGASVLSGWKSPCPYGQLGPGPKPANLSSLVEVGIIADLTVVEGLADTILYLREGLSPPAMLRGGSLREFSRVMLATLIMNYGEMDRRCEANLVVAKMRNNFVSLKFAQNPSVAHELLVKWGKVIKARFDVDNLPLSTKMSSTGLEQVVLCVQQLKTSVDSSESKILDHIRLMGDRLGSLETNMSSVESKVISLAQSRTPKSSPVRSAYPDSPSAGQSTQVLSESLDVAAASTATTECTNVAPSASQAQTFLLWHGGAQDAEQPLKGLTAVEFFTQHMLHKFRFKVSVSDKPRCDTVISSFKAVASPEDSKQLQSEDESVVTRMSLVLHDRVIGRLHMAYNALHKDIPRVLKNWKPLTVNSLTDRITELDKIKPGHKKLMADELTADEVSTLPSRPQKENPFLKRDANRRENANSSSSSQDKKKDLNDNLSSPHKRMKGSGSGTDRREK